MRDLLLQPLLLLHRIKGFFHSSFQGFSFSLPQLCLLSLLLFASIATSIWLHYLKLKVKINSEKLLNIFSFYCEGLKIAIFEK